MRERISDALLAQRDNLFGWVPICLGIGIGVYFSMGQEPDLPVIWMGVGGRGDIANPCKTGVYRVFTLAVGASVNFDWRRPCQMARHDRYRTGA
ncbi:hypothetical protein [Yoonia sp.]|uniref:hypothetical protein n=1 Tax=Yoonia sp. TaxID=2212373 RepID=UPI003423E0A3